MRYGGSYDRDYIDKARDYQAWRGDPDLRSLASVLKKISNNKDTSPEKLIDEHVDWLKSLFQKFHLFIKNRDYTKPSASSYGKKRAWDVQLLYLLPVS